MSADTAAPAPAGAPLETVVAHAEHLLGSSAPAGLRAAAAALASVVAGQAGTSNLSSAVTAFSSVVAAHAEGLDSDQRRAGIAALNARAAAMETAANALASPQSFHVIVSFVVRTTALQVSTSWRRARGPPPLRVEPRKFGGWNYSITDASVLAVTSNSRVLSVDLSYCCSITAASVLSLAQCPRLTAVNFESGTEGLDISDEMILTLVKNCPRLSSLNLNWNEHVTDRAVTAVANGLPSLTAIGLNFCTITDTGVHALTRCPLLVAVELSGCAAITRPAMLTLLRSCNLAKIDMCVGKRAGMTRPDPPLFRTHRGGSWCSVATVQDVASNCPQLTSLKAEGDYYFNRHGNRDNAIARNQAIESLFRTRPLLTEVDLSDSSLSDAAVRTLGNHGKHLRKLFLRENRSITDDPFYAVSQGCPRLEVLELDYCDRITDETLIMLAGEYAEGWEEGGCPLLTNVTLDECTKITDVGGVALSKCSRLRILKLQGTGCGDATLCAIGRNCPELTELCTGYHKNTTDRGGAAVAQGCAKLASLTFFADGTSDATLRALAAGCPALNYLFIGSASDLGIEAIARGCSQLASLSCDADLSDAALLALAAGCPGLNDLQIGSARLTDRGIVVLAQRCLELTELRFYGSPDITEESACALARCQVLFGLDLGGGPAITDDFVAALATCPRMRELSLSRCPITDAALHALSQGAPCLKEISLYQVRNLSAAAKDQLRATHPGINIT